MLVGSSAIGRPLLQYHVLPRSCLGIALRALGLQTASRNGMPSNIRAERHLAALERSTGRTSLPFSYFRRPDRPADSASRWDRSNGNKLDFSSRRLGEKYQIHGGSRTDGEERQNEARASKQTFRTKRMREPKEKQLWAHHVIQSLARRVGLRSAGHRDLHAGRRSREPACHRCLERGHHARLWRFPTVPARLRKAPRSSSLRPGRRLSKMQV